mmetsp:Transcript_44791/g.106195  ORF Transcript_44791/g.106195 Transcript_44791/m.106195 type:complete len:244 (-) Transcript_44791:303-1034(-)
MSFLELSFCPVVRVFVLLVRTCPDVAVGIRAAATLRKTPRAEMAETPRALEREAALEIDKGLPALRPRALEGEDVVFDVLARVVDASGELRVERGLQMFLQLLVELLLQPRNSLLLSQAKPLAFQRFKHFALHFLRNQRPRICWTGTLPRGVGVVWTEHIAPELLLFNLGTNEFAEAACAQKMSLAVDAGTAADPVERGRVLHANRALRRLKLSCVHRIGMEQTTPLPKPKKRDSSKRRVDHG